MYCPTEDILDLDCPSLSPATDKSGVEDEQLPVSGVRPEINITSNNSNQDTSPNLIVLSPSRPDLVTRRHLQPTPCTTKLPVKQNLCWRCGHPGHRRINCDRRPVLFCSRCGSLGWMSRECLSPNRNKVQKQSNARLEIGRNDICNPRAKQRRVRNRRMGADPETRPYGRRSNKRVIWFCFKYLILYNRTLNFQQVSGYN